MSRSTASEVTAHSQVVSGSLWDRIMAAGGGLSGFREILEETLLRVACRSGICSRKARQS